MITQEMKVIRYDASSFGSLMAELKTLSSFAGIAAWDQRAQAEVERIISVIHYVDAEITKQLEILERFSLAFTKGLTAAYLRRLDREWVNLIANRSRASEAATCGKIISEARIRWAKDRTRDNFNH